MNFARFFIRDRFIYPVDVNKTSRSILSNLTRLLNYYDIDYISETF